MSEAPLFVEQPAQVDLNDLFVGPADLKVVLDVCELDLSGPREVAGNANETANLSATVLIKPTLWSCYLILLNSQRCWIF